MEKSDWAGLGGCLPPLVDDLQQTRPGSEDRDAAPGLVDLGSHLVLLLSQLQQVSLRSVGGATGLPVPQLCHL